MSHVYYYKHRYNLHRKKSFLTKAKDKLRMNRNRLIKEIAVILVIKLAVLLVIKAVWFDKPTIPKNYTPEVQQHLLGSDK